MKWYEKKWFMWAALVFFAPLGWFLLYCHRHEFTKKQLYAIAGISAVWFTNRSYKRTACEAVRDSKTNRRKYFRSQS